MSLQDFASGNASGAGKLPEVFRLLPGTLDVLRLMR